MRPTPVAIIDLYRLYGTGDRHVGRSQRDIVIPDIEVRSLWRHSVRVGINPVSGGRFGQHHCSSSNPYQQPPAAGDLVGVSDDAVAAL